MSTITDTTSTTDTPTSRGPARAFLEGCGQALLEPGKFFRERFAHWPLGHALSFGAVLIQAAMFGAVHIVSDLDPSRLATVFPGLLFGVVRAWRGGIGACIVLHALCNLFASTLARGWG
ncbi:MAG: CPBP family intramembrane metalloprotease [Bdellovibrionales bacterium]|nr:CPBP family intramembrane metalloprotease [Bdellovibrionales bacterium]